MANRDIRQSPYCISVARQSGSAFVYILIAIALLAALTVTTMQPSSQQSQTQNATQLVSQLNSQIGFIQSAVQECVITYPGGDSGVNESPQSNKGAAPADWGANSPYPINPTASYLNNGSDADAEPERLVKHIHCPGNPGDDPDPADIFGGSSGRFLPKPPDIFEEGWKWYNGRDGVFFWIATDNSDPFIKTAFDKLNNQFSDCQVDQIDATGGEVKLAGNDDDGTPKCKNGQRCLRYWMVLNDVSSPASGHTESCP